MSQDLSQLIKLNERIVSQNNKLINQNTEIIDLLRKIAGEEEIEEIEYAEPPKSRLKNDAAIGEVYFIEGDDVFQLTIKENETIVNNLTSSTEPSDFALQELIAKESIKNNAEIPYSTVILSDSQSGNLPNTLKICVEEEATHVFLPWSSMTQLIGAPDTIMTLLKLNFYKTTEELVEKLFGAND